MDGDIIRNINFKKDINTNDLEELFSDYLSEKFNTILKCSIRDIKYDDEKDSCISFNLEVKKGNMTELMTK